MSAAGRRVALRVAGAVGVVGGLVALVVTGCGVPGDGPVERLDDDTVPYRLLEPADATGPDTDTATSGPVPSVFWLRDDRLVPAPTGASCAAEPADVVTEVLEVLAEGPPDDERVGGRSTAIPPESSLALADLADGTAAVEFGAATTISADRLPLAVGQIALAVSSAPGVRSVQLVGDGEPVPVPLPGGVLATGPVTADDYADLLPASFRRGAVGCPES